MSVGATLVSKNCAGHPYHRSNLPPCRAACLKGHAANERRQLCRLAGGRLGFAEEVVAPPSMSQGIQIMPFRGYGRRFPDFGL